MKNVKAIQTHSCVCSVKITQLQIYAIKIIIFFFFNVGAVGSGLVARGASGCNAPTTNLKVSVRNLHNIKHQPTDQRAKNITLPPSFDIQRAVHRALFL
jgi:hypothetical protein